MPFLLLFCTIPFGLKAQSGDAAELLEKSIAFHDPQGNWEQFNGVLYVSMKTPDRPDRNSEISIDLPKEYFSVTAQIDTTKTTYTLEKEVCSIALNGNSDLTDQQLKDNNLSCDRAKLYKDYYTYLYGLPMKIKDPGTNIDPKAELVNFKGKSYWRLKVNYTEEVGSDVWFFYLNPDTFALEVYQFFKGEPDGKGKDTGEYILLNNLKTINGIKMPKDRAWYYNKGDKHLGTDYLTSADFKAN